MKFNSLIYSINVYHVPTVSQAVSQVLGTQMAEMQALLLGSSLHSELGVMMQS